MISHTQRFFNPPGLLPPLPYTGNPLRALSRSVEDIHFDLNRNTLPDRQLHDNAKLFYDFKNKNMATLPYIGRNNTRPCYSPYPNMASMYYKTSPERKDMNVDRSPGLKPMWPMDHVGEYCAELLNRDKHYWTEEETGLMLELYEENKDYFNDNKTKKTKLWSVIANIINKRFTTNVNSEQCSQKYRNLKAEFLKIADPTSLDGGAKKFGRHFIQMKRLIDAEEKSMKNNHNNNWNGKESAQNVNKGGGSMQLSSNDNSPTDPESAQMNPAIQLSQCPSSTQNLQPSLPDIQPTLTLSTPLSLDTTGNLITTKLDLSSNDQQRQLDLNTPNTHLDNPNDPVIETFDSPDGSENQCMMNNTTQLNQSFRDKNQCLIDTMAALNQAVSGGLSQSVTGGLEHSLRDISPSIEPASEVVLSNSPKREVLINMSSQDAQLLKLPRASPQSSESTEQNFLSLEDSENRQPSLSDAASDATIDFQESSTLNISPYSNELNEIFNDYFSSRGKELEVYESKERQNIVCMNKCIDVFRKIMMEKIN